MKSGDGCLDASIDDTCQHEAHSTDAPSRSIMTSLKSGSDAPAGSPFMKHTLSPHTPFNKSRAMARHWTESASEGSLMDVEALRGKILASEAKSKELATELDNSRMAYDSLSVQYSKLEQDLSRVSQAQEDYEKENQDLRRELCTVVERSEEEQRRLMMEQEALTSKQDELSAKLEHLGTPLASVNGEIGHSRRQHRCADASDVLPASQTQASHSSGLLVKLETQDSHIRELEKVNEGLRFRCSTQRKMLETEIRTLKETIQILHTDNHALREDISSYQTLLRDKTVSGEFSHSHFMRSSNSNAGHDSIRGLPHETDLATDLGSVSLDSSDKDHEAGDLEAEIKSLQETNKALTLYINTIVTRLLETEGFEQLLAREPARHSKTVTQPHGVVTETKCADELDNLKKHPSFFDRTRSVLTGRARKQKDPAADRVTNTYSVNEDPFTSLSLTSVTPPAFRLSSSPKAFDESRPNSRRSSHTRPVTPPRSVHSSGLKPLASEVIADHVTPKQARRLSAQFAPSPTPQVPRSSSRIAANVGDAEKPPQRISWMGWIGGRVAASDVQKSEESERLSL